MNKPKGYKKWCEYCRLMIVVDDFNSHCKTRNHLRNKERALDFSRKKHRKMREE